MTIGTLNEAQFNAISSIMTLRARELVGNMIAMDISDAHDARGGANSADYTHNSKGGNFSTTA